MSNDTLTPGHCHKCGMPYIDNPHPDAGKPDRYLEVGVPKECVPCLVLSRHQWAGRAMKAERALAAIEAQVEQPTLPLTDDDIRGSREYSITRDKGCFHAGALWARDRLLAAAPPAPAQQSEAIWTLKQIADMDPRGTAGSAVFMAKEALSSEQAQPSLQPPSEPGVYAWHGGSCVSLVLVNKRPSNHSPGGVLNGHVIEPSKFYDGCPVTSWTGGRWFGPLKQHEPVGVSQPVAPDLRKVAEAVREAAAHEAWKMQAAPQFEPEFHDKQLKIVENAIRAIDIDALIESVKGK